MLQPAECFGFNVEIRGYILLWYALDQVRIGMNKIHKAFADVEFDVVLLPLLLFKVQLCNDHSTHSLKTRTEIIQFFHFRS